MTARTHDTFAFASLVTLAVWYPPTSLNLATLFAALVSSVVGSLLPDMDQASNRLWDLLPGGNFLGRIFRRLFLGHRTISHSLLGVYLFYRFFEWVLPKFLNPIYIDPHLVSVALITGIVSHLIADSLTQEGIPLLFPFPFKFGFPPFSSWRITTGSWFENLVVFPAVLVYLFFFLKSHWSTLIQILNTVVAST